MLTVAISQVMLPGKKQRIEVPGDPLTGQTIVRPARLGLVITASSEPILDGDVTLVTSSEPSAKL